MVLTRRQKDGISSLIGTLCHKFAVSALSVLSLLYPYYVSVCYRTNHSLKVSDGFFMYPLYNIAYFCSIAIGGFIDRPLGPTRTMSLGMLILVLVGVGFFLSENIVVDYLLMFFCGLGIGFGDQVTPKNACYYFPDYKGFLATCLIAFQYLAGALFSYLGEQVFINPNKKSADKNTGIYHDDEITDNTQTFSIFCSAIACCFSLLACILIVQYNPAVHSIELERNQMIGEDEAEETEKDENNPDEPKEEKKAEEAKGEDVEEKKENLLNEDDNAEQDEVAEGEEEAEADKGVLDNPENMEGYLGMVMKSWRFWRMFVISICGSFVLTLGAVVYKPLGSAYEISEGALQDLVTGNLVITSIFTPISGWLSDRYPFKYIMLTISIGATLFGICINFTREAISYTIMIYIDYFLTGFAYSFTQHIMKVFGMKYFIEIYGMIAVSLAVAYILSTTFAFIMEAVAAANAEESKEGSESEDSSLVIGLNISFFLGAALAGSSIFMSAFESDDKFIPVKYLTDKYFGQDDDPTKKNKDLLPEGPQVVEEAQEPKPSEEDPDEPNVPETE